MPGGAVASVPTTEEILDNEVCDGSGYSSGRPPPFDIADIRSNCAGDMKMMEMILRSYRPDSVAQLSTLLEATDMVRLPKLAHKVKGTFRYLCAKEATELALRVEQGSKALAAHFEALPAAFEEVKAAIELLRIEASRVHLYTQAALKELRATAAAETEPPAEKVPVACTASATDLAPEAPVAVPAAVPDDVAAADAATAAAPGGAVAAEADAAAPTMASAPAEAGAETPTLASAPAGPTSIRTPPMKKVSSFYATDVTSVASAAPKDADAACAKPQLTQPSPMSAAQSAASDNITAAATPPRGHMREWLRLLPRSSFHGSPLSSTANPQQGKQVGSMLNHFERGEARSSLLCSCRVTNLFMLGAAAGWIIINVTFMSLVRADSFKTLGDFESQVVFIAATLQMGSLLTDVLTKQQISDSLEISNTKRCIFIVQQLALLTNVGLHILPTPFYTDAITQRPNSITRWCEWSVLAFMMTFIVEAIDSTNLRTPLTTALTQSVSTFCGLLLPFCEDGATWACLCVVSFVLFFYIFVRLYQKEKSYEALRLTLPLNSYALQRAELARNLLRMCVAMWTTLVLIWTTDVVWYTVLGNPWTATSTDWCFVANCIVDVAAKTVYSSIIYERSEVVFMTHSMQQQKLLQQRMNRFWKDSHDLLIVSQVTVSLGPCSTYRTVSELSRSGSAVTVKLSRNCLAWAVQ